MIYSQLLIDSPFLAHRSFSLNRRLTTSTGLDSTLIHNFIRSLNPLKQKFPDTELIFCWESYGTLQWRRELYPRYKPQKMVDEGYKTQVRDLQRLLMNLGYHQFYSPCNEADDVIATLCRLNGDNSMIFTVDKDLMQLIDKKTHMYNGKLLFTEKDVKDKYLVLPDQIPDLLAIWGDVSDSIDGIESFGLKKASEILSKYRHIEMIPETEPIYRHIEKIKLNKKLTTLNTSCPLVDYVPLPFQSTNDIIRKYELKTIGENIDMYKSGEYETTKQSTFV